MIYLDYAATTPVDPEVFEAMRPWFIEHFGNPSSIHQFGQVTRAAVDEARAQISSFLNCSPNELYFTGSGTESCNWALLGVLERKLLKGQKTHLIISSIEHSSVFKIAQFLEKSYGVEVTYLPVNSDGIVSVGDVEDSITADTSLVSIMTVNNEIGTIQPISSIAHLCHEKGIYFHTDACQAAAYLDLDVAKSKVDLLSLSASKIYGPKGVGILYLRQGIEISNWTFGGEQEFGLRAGTENVPGIVGMAKAIELIPSYKKVNEKIGELRNYLWEEVEANVEAVKINGSLKNRAPNNLNFLIEGVVAKLLVQRMDMAGFAISTTAACSSSIDKPSHVLIALGLTEKEAMASIRVTLGKLTVKDDISKFVEKLSSVVQELRSK